MACHVTSMQSFDISRHVMCHHILCHAKVVHLLVMCCYDTDLHVMSRPFFSCPFVSCDVCQDRSSQGMSAKILSHVCASCQLESSPHMSRQGRSSQSMSAHIKSHVFAECQIRDRFRRLSHIDLFSHCLALLLPDSLSVWAS